MTGRLTLAFTYFLEAISQVECVKENLKKEIVENQSGYEQKY